MQLRRGARGFTLTELAVVLAIVGLLLGGMIMTVSAQVEQRYRDETLRQVNAAVEAIQGFALVNRRLPCPARYVSAASNSQGQESFCAAATGTCAGSEVTTVQTHGNCSNFYNGYLPAASLGIGPVDSAGFAVDSWGNRLRYAVAAVNVPSSCTTTAPSSTTRIFTSQSNLKTYGIGCKPNDLDICTSAGCTVRAVSQQTAVFIVFSTGKNGANAALYGPDETTNDGADAIFVTRPVGDVGTGAYDDIMAVVPVGMLYSKLLASGALP